jgi:hypothetical protein
MSTQPSSSNTYTLPTSLHAPLNPHSTPRTSWKQRLNILKPASTIDNDVPHDNSTQLRRGQTTGSTRSKHVPKWWKVRLFRGMVNDLRRRAPFYLSDWTDAWDYRVVPATIYMYFAKYVHYLRPENMWVVLMEIVFCQRWRSHWICKYASSQVASRC